MAEQLATETLKARLRRFNDTSLAYGRGGSSGNAALNVDKQAAVLVLLRWCAEACEWQVLLTVRSAALRRHGGEVSFAGGVRDDADAEPAETALREALEEVGLPFAAADVVCTLRPFRSRYNYALFPVVAVQRAPFAPLPNAAEVAHCFWLPLARFLSARRHSMLSFAAAEHTFKTHSFQDDLVGVERPVITWGLTAIVAVVVAMISFERKPEFAFPVHFDVAPPPDATWQQIVSLLLETAIEPTFTRRNNTDVAKL